MDWGKVLKGAQKRDKVGMSNRRQARPKKGGGGKFVVCELKGAPQQRPGPRVYEDHMRP